MTPAEKDEAWAVQMVIEQYSRVWGCSVFDADLWWHGRPPSEQKRMVAAMEFVLQHDRMRQAVNASSHGQIAVTPEMVEAGYKVLCKSGMSDTYLDADKLIVEDIFLAMHAAEQKSID